MVYTNNGHVFCFSGVEENELAASGIGILLHKDFENSLCEWSGISDRIMTMKIKNSKGIHITIIGVYAPTEDETKERKDKFWNRLTEVTETAEGLVLVMGDFNARVGVEDCTSSTVVGKYGEMHKNNNGCRMIQYCHHNNLCITNTLFKHKDIHKFTREYQSRNEKSIIDYILIENPYKKIVKDSRVMRKAEIGSDHYLLVATLNIYEKIIKYETINTYKRRNSSGIQKRTLKQLEI